MSSSWLEELEARLEQQLEGFLRSNPQQEELLREQTARDRQRRLLEERLQLRQQAEEHVQVRAASKPVPVAVLAVPVSPQRPAKETEKTPSKRHG